MKCRQCEKEINANIDICSKCAKENLLKTLANEPKLKQEIIQHFKEMKQFYEQKRKG